MSFATSFLDPSNARCLREYVQTGGLGQQNAREIDQFCNKEKISIAGRIAFGHVVTARAKKTVVEYSPRTEVSRKIREMWSNIISGV